MAVAVDGFGHDLVGGGLLATGERLDTDDGGEEQRHHGSHEGLAGEEGEGTKTHRHESTCEKRVK